MKKTALIFAILVLIVIMPFSASATADSIEQELSDRLFSNISDDVSDALEDFGIDSLDFQNIYNVSFENIVSYFKSTLSEKFSGALKFFVKLLTVVLIVSSVCVFVGDEKSNQVLMFIGAAIIIILTVDDINYCLSSSISMLKVSNSFMIAFVPVFATVIALSGNPSSALTYSSLVLLAGEIISAIINYGIVDIIGAFFCIGISFAINSNFNINRLIGVTNRIVTFILGIASSVFASMLSIKSVMSVSADSVATRGVRFLLSSLIPVVGSSISEAYSSLLGSISLIKGSVALVGIIVIVIINIPIIAEIILYYISMSVLSFICELMDSQMLSGIFKVFVCGLRIILLLTVFEMFVLLISTGIMMTFKGG